jgi:hypothetical protein
MFERDDEELFSKATTTVKKVEIPPLIIKDTTPLVIPPQAQLFF